MQLKENGPLRFRCHTGHAYSLESLLAEFTERAEDTLWNAIRALEETEMLLMRMARCVADHHHPEMAATLKTKAEEWKHRATLVREAVMTSSPVPASDGAASM